MSEHETIAITRATGGAAPIAGPELVIPRQLGSVRLVRQIGEGGMGVVWLGHDDMLGRAVAVKFLLGAMATEGDPHFQTFLEGARAAAALQHPGLTAIYHADLVDKFPFMVMEYVDGPTLAQVLLKRGGLGLSPAAAVMDATCEAIGELHDREIVHRDIKPANVMLMADGPNARVVVTDFGLTCGRTARTGGGASGGGAGVGIAGTPAYMPPEMFEGTVSPRGDVYSLGAMFYELLTDEVPHQGPLETMAARKRGEPLDVGPLKARDVPQEVIEVIERALHGDALFRYKSARHLQRALREAYPNPGLWKGTAGALGDILEAHVGRKGEATAQEPEGVAGSYYDHLSTMVRRKQRPEEVPDVLCEACGGVCPGEGVPCPACGHLREVEPVERGLEGADPRWKRRVGLGALALIGSGGVLGAAVLLGVGERAMGEVEGWRRTVGVFSDAFWLVGGVGLLVGFIAMALPERGGPQGGLRAVERLTLLSVAIVGMAVHVAGGPIAFSENRIAALAGAASSAMALAAVGGVAAWFLFGLSRRGGDRGLAWRGIALGAAAGATLLCAPISLASLAASAREAGVLLGLDGMARGAFAALAVAAGLRLRWLFRPIAGGEEGEILPSAG